jgi:hypothetical protein
MLIMKNIVKILIATVAIVMVFTACQKEGDLPLYKTGNGTVVSSSVSSVTAAVADSGQTVLTVNWTWPNYATDSAHQKFILQIDSAGQNFVHPFSRVLFGVTSTSFTAKELNTIVFGFGCISDPYTLEMRIISSYGNNNEQYQSNTITAIVTPYIIPVTLSIAPAGPLTLVVEEATNTAVVFSWNATQYGNIPLYYAVEIDKAGGTFATPTVLKFAAALTGSITVNDLNNAAINAGIAPTETGDLAIRVNAHQGDYPGTNPLYSNVVTLTVTTYLSVMTWYVPGNYAADSYPGYIFNNWDPANSPQVKSISSAPTKLEGYVYMANATNEWKFASKPNWDGPNYGAGAAPGTLDASGGNFSSDAGYYKLNADASALTYTAVATVWGVIGAATPGGWGDETGLVYDPTSRAWTGGLHLTVGEFKFRANHDWGYNYGSTAGNATLDAGGSNIPVAFEADYFFMLDLSHPNEYTYNANRWGLIGSATPDGWNSDQNMTWDATNKAMTITLDLVAGEFKFRANDDWGYNLGGDITALTPNGANIAIADAGNYTINLYLSSTPHCTVVKNGKK